MDHLDLMRVLEEKAKLDREASKAIGEKCITKPSVINFPWSNLASGLEFKFNEILESKYNCEVRSEKGKQKTELEIKYESYELLQANIEQMKESTVINESNLSLFFNCYTPDEQVEQILNGKKFIRLNRGHGDYVAVEISDISAELAADHDFTIELIDLSLKGGFNASELITERLRKTIKAELAQIKVDFIDLLTGA